MKRILIALAIGTVLTGVGFVFAGFVGGACHCVTPTTILFPYAAIVFGREWDPLGVVLLVVQYPIYAALLAWFRGIKARALALAILLLSHTAGVFVGLKVFRH